MTKVFQIRPDHRYSPLCVEGSSSLKKLFLEGLPVDNWEPISLYIDNPLKPKPDFWWIGANIAFDPDRLEMKQLPIGAHLEDAGQWLRVDVEDLGSLSVLNVTTVANAIDVARTKWAPYDDNTHRYVDDAPGSYAFHEDRLPETSIFKIPQNSASQILCWEQTGDPDHEFKAAVEAEKLTGLQFRLLWQS